MIKIEGKEFKDIYEVRAEHFGTFYTLQIPANSAEEARNVARYQNGMGVAFRIHSVKGQFFDWPGKEQSK